MSIEQAKSELSRLIKLRPLPGDVIAVEADESERSALAKRFGLPAVHDLRSEVALEKDGNSILVRGSLTAEIVQNCAISGEEFPVSINDPLLLRFVEAQDPEQSEKEADEIEIELTDDDCDEIEFSGDAIDLGEAIAQSLGLAIDPYAEGPNADRARQEKGISGDDEPSGPLAEALKALKQ